MRLTLRHGYLPADLDGLLFVAPLRDDAKNIYNAGGGIDAAAPATQVVDALGTFIHPATGLITPATANVLRVGSGLDLASRLKGALFEAARPNKCLQSEDFGTTWTVTRSSVTANDIAAPDDVLTADKIVEDSTASNTHLVTQAISVTSGQKVAISVFAKKKERSEILLQAGGTAAPAAATVWFDLNAGTKGTVGAGVDDSGIDDLGNGWYRCWLVFTADATDTFSFDILLGSGSETSSYNGDGTSGIFLWGAQCEENVSFPSSYIKTTTVAVTRAKDDIRFDNTSEVNVKASAGTVYVACTPLFDAAENTVHGWVITAMESDNTDGWSLYFHPTDNDWAFDVRTNNTSVAGLRATTQPVRGTPHVLAATWKSADFRLYVDGTEEASDTAGDPPSAQSTSIYIGQDKAQDVTANMNMAHIHVYDSAHDAARVLANSNEIRRWLGLV